MSSKWIAEIFALALSIGSLTPLHGEEAPSPTIVQEVEAQKSLAPSGKQMITEVETAYRKGEYDLFLVQLQEQYTRAGKAGLLRTIFEKATKAKAPEVSAEDKDSIEKKRQERNRKLLEIVQAHPSAAIAEKVNSVVHFSLSPVLGDILTELDSLKYKIKDSSQSPLEDTMAALETEYYIKSLLLEIGHHRSGSSARELEKKKIVLTLEKLDKMEDVAQKAEDSIWVEKIEKAQLAFRTEKAFVIDLDLLKGLAKGNIEPQNSVEQKVKQIMIDYSD